MAIFSLLRDPPFWAHFGPFWDPILGLFWAILGPLRAHLSPFKAHLGPYNAYKALIDLIRALNRAHYSSIIVIKRLALTHFESRRSIALNSVITRAQCDRIE